MRYPQDRQIDDLIDAVSSTDWAYLRRALKAARKRDRERAVVDGYPSSTTGGGRGGAELTSVESAARLRIGVGDKGEPLQPLRDPVHVNVEQAFGYLMDLVNSRRALLNRLGDLERSGGLNVERFLCEGYQLIGVDRTAEHFGDVAGKLPTKRRLSDEVVKFVSKYGRMPTVEEMRSYNASNRWRVRATA